MVEREQLLEAISTLEAQRDILGNAVVDLTVTALQEKIAVLGEGLVEQSLPRASQRKQVTILFATVTGFAGMTESFLDTNMRDVMNALWQRLDAAILQQDGAIDKHIGDGVMGLFGVPVVREDDVERAIRAALAMRAALSDFVNEMSEHGAGLNGEEGGTPADQMIESLRDLRLQIGINTGPVLVGYVGAGEEYTVIGDAVNVASRLQRAAPAGGILISHDTYVLVRGIFNVESLGPVVIKGRSEPIQVYLVLGVKPRDFYSTSRGVEGVETQMVGRDQEMQQLQAALHTAVKTRQGQVITIVGEAGVGKSRLLHEFNNWIKSLDQKVVIFKARTDQRVSQLPYSLARDLFTTTFNVLDNDRPAVAEEKLVSGLHAFMPDLDMVAIRSRVRAIGQLVGLDLAETTLFPIFPAESPQVRDQVFAYVADFFEAATASAATLILLEDLHWADEGSLALFAHVAQVCRHAPLLLIGLSRQPPAAEQPLWQVNGNASGAKTVEAPHMVMELLPLSDTESRQLVVDILRKAPEIPVDLCDLIVSRAEGNPFYVEELIKSLIEDGVIVIGEQQWLVQRNQLTRVPIPPTLTGVLQARLDRLSEPERVSLQRAAVIGRIFWDSAVIHMNEMADVPLRPAETMTALHTLVKRELIFQRQASLFAGTRAYLFKHAMLRDVVYESVLLRERPVYHKQVANWLAEQSGERVAEYAGLIAEHYELAGERTPAAELYEMAAVRVQDSDPEAAITYYGKSLSLLSDKAHQASWQLRLQERLGQLLRLRARLVGAAQTYMTMRFTAELDGDLTVQARAWNGLADVQRQQADYTAMLESAIQAEQVAWLVNAELELIHSLRLKGEAYWRLGDVELAIAATTQALTMSEKLNDAPEITHSLTLLGSIYAGLGRHARVGYCLDRLQEQVTTLEDADAPQALGFAQLSLGNLHNKLGRYDKSAYYLLAALKRYQDVTYQPGVGEALNRLGEAAQMRGNARAAVSLYRQALSVAASIGDQYNALFYRTNLGGALIASGHYSTAETELKRVLRLAEDVSKVVNWLGLADAYSHLAQAYLEMGQMQEAMAAARQAHRLALQLGNVRVTGVAWRVLGLVASKKPAHEPPVVIAGTVYDAPACFAESLRLFKQVNGGGHGSYRQQALTLQAWAAYEATLGNNRRSQEMKAQAQDLTQRVGIVL